MELVKNKLSTTILKTSKYSQFTINDDFNVPDAKPDVGRLIQHKDHCKYRKCPFR